MASFEFGRDRHELKDMPTVNAVPIEDILKQHDLRFVIHTEAHGDIIIKYLPQRMKRIIDMMRHIRYPECEVLEEERDIIAPEVLAGECGQDTIDRLTEICLQLQPSYDMYFLGCIEYPFLTTMDELDSLMESLTMEESDVLREALMVLSSQPGKVDDTYLAIAQKFGVQVIDKHLLDNMTMQQYAVFDAIIGAEHSMTERMYKEMRKI